jgi:Protein of unknown function (DUF1566)
MKTIAIRFGAAAVVAVFWTVPTRANAPAGRYTANGGTVYDVKTKLTWQQPAPTATYSWANAKTYCASAAVSSALGGSGWRLPTIKELQTLVDYSQTTPPAIDQSYFSGTQTTDYWSSSSLAGGPSSSVWVVSFYDGSTNSGSGGFVRCVR